MPDVRLGSEFCSSCFSSNLTLNSFAKRERKRLDSSFVFSNNLSYCINILQVKQSKPQPMKMMEEKRTTTNERRRRRRKKSYTSSDVIVDNNHRLVNALDRLALSFFSSSSHRI